MSCHDVMSRRALLCFAVLCCVVLVMFRLFACLLACLLLLPVGYWGIWIVREVFNSIMGIDSDDDSAAATADNSAVIVITPQHWQAAVQLWRLSERQDAVLRGVFHGRSFDQIGKSIHRSRDTVDTHWRETKKKLHAVSIIDAIHCIYAQIIVPMEVTAATEPLLRQIDELKQRVEELEQERCSM